MYYYYQGQLLKNWMGKLPTGAVEVTDAEAETMINAVLAGKKLTETSAGRPITVDPVPSLSDYETAVQRHIDATAQENDFDGILSCTKYIGFENDFSASAMSLLAWNAACWAACHVILNAVRAGTRTAPAVGALIAELPAYVRPDESPAE